MRPTSKVTVTLATLLFASPAPAQQFTADRDAMIAAIREVSQEWGPNAVQDALSVLAYAYGYAPETAATRMTACLAAVEAARVELPLPASRRAVTR